MTVKDKLMIYIYRKMTELEKEKDDIRRQLRFQPMDNLDIYELLLSDVRINAWNEFIEDLFNIVLNCK